MNSANTTAKLPAENEEKPPEKGMLGGSTQEA